MILPFLHVLAFVESYFYCYIYSNHQTEYFFFHSSLDFVCFKTKQIICLFVSSLVVVCLKTYKKYLFLSFFSRFCRLFEDIQKVFLSFFLLFCFCYNTQTEKVYRVPASSICQVNKFLICLFILLLFLIIMFLFPHINQTDWLI